VLVAPADSAVQLKIAPNFPLAAAPGNGRLATGDPASVPVGRYAQAALMKLGVRASVAWRIAGAENVRAALAFVSRGEGPLGIVYTTDAKVDPKVRVVDTFPADTHRPITYPAALVETAQPDAEAFVRFLASDDAQAVFSRYGFLPPTAPR
jgi:molybdate transport system substrate-binding protein